MTKEEAFEEINTAQDYYVEELKKITTDDNNPLKAINFTSATGTGKTKMIAKLINSLPTYFFIITTLSRGQLNKQTKRNLKEDCKNSNFIVYGNQDLKINSVLQAEDVISLIPNDKRCIWIRDEGHIKTNRFENAIADKCYRVINFSATNDYDDIRCNFAHTMMLRTVNQQSGTPRDAIKKLIEIKKQHKNIIKYNPCAIFRCVGENADIIKEIESLCNEFNLKMINIIDNDSVISELCKDDNKYDVIVNKMKIVEGIDIRRAHVLYMDNKPNNPKTTIQLIGRCRRNALLYRNDIDILAPKNKQLLKQTRQCFVYFNVKGMKADTDKDGELRHALSNTISCEELKPDVTIEVIDGCLNNGLQIIELEGKTGKFRVIKDKKTGFNKIEEKIDFYEKIERPKMKKYLYLNEKYKINIKDTKYFKYGEYYDFGRDVQYKNKTVAINQDNVEYFITRTQEVLELFQNTFGKTTIQEIIENMDYKKIEENINFITKEKKAPKGHFLMYKRLIGLEGLEIEKNLTIKDLFDKKQILIIANFILNNNDASLKDVIKPCIKNFIKLYPNYKNFKRKNVAAELYKELYKTDELSTPKDFILYKNSFEEIDVTKQDIDKYIDNYIEDMKNDYQHKQTLTNPKEAYKIIANKLNSISDKLNKHIVDEVIVNRYSVIKRMKEDEITNYRTKVGLYCSAEQIEYLKEYLEGPSNFTYIYNDEESSIIGADTPRDSNVTSVTGKIINNCKLSKFLEKKYKDELSSVETQLFSYNNSVSLKPKNIPILGCCVEYYAKYLLYGDEYMHIQKSETESEYNKNILTACLKRFKSENYYWNKNLKYHISQNNFMKNINEQLDIFMNLLIEMGKETAIFLRKNSYINDNNHEEIDWVYPDLSIKHIHGVADYITQDTIIDIKVKNSITKKDILQVLAYHYLSTKRLNLNIKRVIVYDAVSRKNIRIDITEKNLSNYSR